MAWIDGHLDLAMLVVEGRDLRAALPADAPACVSLPALREARVELALGTIFTAPDDPGAGGSRRADTEAARRAGLEQLRIYRELDAAGELRLVRSLAEADAADARPAVMLLMEGADPIRDANDVAWWHAAGLRLVGLTWADGTRYAGGNACAGGLTTAGRELVAALDDHGVIHDASHLSDAAFDDLLGCARGRIVATHSNCRALVRDEQRHLRDDQVRAIAERDGVIGLNLYGRFLADGRDATLDDCVAHVERVAEAAGRRDVVALGSDLDGGFDRRALPRGFTGPESLERLAEGLARAGWSAPEIEGFRAGNWRRVLPP